MFADTAPLGARDSRDVTLDLSLKNRWKLPELLDIKPDQVEIAQMGLPEFGCLYSLDFCGSGTPEGISTVKRIDF